jgi:hypothetical protein
METLTDSATVPWVWQVEVGNALGKAVILRPAGPPSEVTRDPWKSTFKAALKES